MLVREKSLKDKIAEQSVAPAPKKRRAPRVRVSVKKDLSDKKK